MLYHELHKDQMFDQLYRSTTCISIPTEPSPSVSPSVSPSLLSYQIQNQVEALNANLLQASIAVNPDENAIIARNPVQVEFNEARAVSQ